MRFLKILLFALGCLNIQAYAQPSIAVTTVSNCQTQIVTLNSFSANKVSYALSPNQIVTITTMYGTYNNGQTTVGLTSSGGTNLEFKLINAAYPLPATFTGLTNISVQSPATYSSYLTFTVLTPITNSAPVTPANSVVIPSDAAGNVQILLESSSDMVNWIPSQAGEVTSLFQAR